MKILACHTLKQDSQVCKFECSKFPQTCGELTATLIAREHAIPKDRLIRINSFADFECIGACSHRVDVHLILLFEILEEVDQTRPKKRDYESLISERVNRDEMRM